MTVRSTIAYWRAAGLTPDEAMAGLGVRRPLACTWAEVEVVAAMRERALLAAAVERETAPRARAAA
jgi:hypothetical protein